MTPRKPFDLKLLFRLELLADDLLLKIFLMNTLVKKIPGTSENLSFNPTEIISYKRVCKRFNDLINKNKHLFGIHHASSAADLYQEMGPDILSLYPEEFHGIQMIVGELINAFPLLQNHYVGLGNSPVPFTAYLQMVFPQALVTNLPLSKMNVSDSDFPTDWKNYKKNFIQYLDYFLKGGALDQFLNHNKDIVLIDYVKSGISLRLARDLIIYYLIEHCLTNSFQNFSQNSVHYHNLYSQKMDEFSSRVKLFSLTSPERKYLRFGTFEEKTSKFISLPPIAHKTIMLEENPHLARLENELDSTSFKARLFTLFASINYQDIKHGNISKKSLTEPQRQNFGGHLLLSSRLYAKEKAIHKQQKSQENKSTQPKISLL